MMDGNTQDIPPSIHASAFGWRLDADSFNRRLVDLLRAGDAVLPTVAMDEIARDLITLIPICEREQRGDIKVMLDRLASMGTAALRFGRRDLFGAFVHTCFNIYLSGFDEDDNRRRSSAGEGINAPALWLYIAIRILAVGAYAVRLGKWEAVRELALQSFTEFPHRAAGETQYWLRHADVQASNAGLLNSQGPHGRKAGAFISLALRLVDDDLSLRWDMPKADVRLLNSILQFELIGLLVICAQSGDGKQCPVYPSMAAWGIGRAEPVVLKVLSSEHIQEELFASTLDEKFLASFLREVQKYAQHVNFGGWGWSSQQVRELLGRYPETLNG